MWSAWKIDTGRDEAGKDPRAEASSISQPLLDVELTHLEDNLEKRKKKNQEKAGRRGRNHQGSGELKTTQRKNKEGCNKTLAPREGDLSLQTQGKLALDGQQPPW